MRGRTVRALGAAAIAVLMCETAGIDGATPRRFPRRSPRPTSNNPQLNAQRAFVRQTEEQVPLAASGYRPQIAATASAGTQHTDSTLRTQAGLAPRTEDDEQRRRRGSERRRRRCSTVFARHNQVEAAEGNVLAAREVLRLMTQQILLDATTAYMDMLRDTAIAGLQRRNVEMLQEQLRLTRERLEAARGHPHRRVAGRIAAGGRPLAAPGGGIRRSTPRARPTGA